jgi:hypothetical protein
MKLFFLFFAGAFMVAQHGVGAAPVTQDPYPDANKFRSIIDHLLAVPDKNQLCSVRQELDLKNKTLDAISLIEYLDQQALQIHGLICSTDLELLSETGTSLGSEYLSEEPTPEASFPPDHPANPKDNTTMLVQLDQAMKTLLEKASTEPGPDFESVVFSNKAEEELPCDKNRHPSTDLMGAASSFSDDIERANWRFKLAMKILMVICGVLALFIFVFFFCTMIY